MVEQMAAAEEDSCFDSSCGSKELLPRSLAWKDGSDNSQGVVIPGRKCALYASASGTFLAAV